MGKWIKKNFWTIIIVIGFILLMILQQEYANYTQERVDRFLEEKNDN